MKLVQVRFEGDIISGHNICIVDSYGCLNGYSFLESHFECHPSWGCLEPCKLAGAGSTVFSKVP